jgi:small subunit ribosomal protein S1
LTSMLQARWKNGPPGESPKLDSPRTGQVRSFRITRLDPAAKKIEVELA